MRRSARHVNDVVTGDASRMSADDDDRADQQHELANPRMAETDHSVLETPWPQLCSRPVVVQAASGGLQGCR